MKQKQDIRWIQRFSNFKKALFQLKKAVDLASYSVTEFGVEHIFNNVK